MAPWRYPNSGSHITNEITPYWLNPESLDYYMEDKHGLSTLITLACNCN